MLSLGAAADSLAKLPRFRRRCCPGRSEEPFGACPREGRVSSLSFDQSHLDTVSCRVALFAVFVTQTKYSPGMFAARAGSSLVRFSKLPVARLCAFLLPSDDDTATAYARLLDTDGRNEKRTPFAFVEELGSKS